MEIVLLSTFSPFWAHSLCSRIHLRPPVSILLSSSRTSASRRFTELLTCQVPAIAFQGHPLSWRASLPLPPHCARHALRLPALQRQLWHRRSCREAGSLGARLLGSSQGNKPWTSKDATQLWSERGMAQLLAYVPAGGNRLPPLPNCSL